MDQPPPPPFAWVRGFVGAHREGVPAAARHCAISVRACIHTPRPWREQQGWAMTTRRLYSGRMRPATIRPPPLPGACVGCSGRLACRTLDETRRGAPGAADGPAQLRDDEMSPLRCSEEGLWRESEGNSAGGRPASGTEVEQRSGSPACRLYRALRGSVGRGGTHSGERYVRCCMEHVWRGACARLQTRGPRHNGATSADERGSARRAGVLRERVRNPRPCVRASCCPRTPASNRISD